MGSEKRCARHHFHSSSAAAAARLSRLANEAGWQLALIERYGGAQRG